MEMSISDMMKQHTIVDISDDLHVVDGKIIYYETDTIDFESEEQVANFFRMVNDLFVNDFYTEEYGHGNTMLVISGSKDYVRKYVNIDDMVHVPDELLTRVGKAIDEYKSRTSNTI
ncbi:hypothetical protein [Blautia sp. MSJ-36]|uniref:hypothetical protein n=1 Tax=Blautia sp. MSJ-36 TaxID=2841530 RepID=UPI001C0FACFD|nr:hypothetical protein [Blautia sp. MSJ-36]MBU5446320.1 hypothetical protein [Blautia sp. MSJ-36]